MGDQDPIIIIGGGIGGLTAAIHLANHGREVLIVEKNPKIGGKMTEFRHEGFRWDLGPTVITMRDVFDDLFRDSGKRLEDYVQFLPIDPLARYFFSDGKVLNIHRDLPRTLDNIASLGTHAVEEYLAFLAYAARQFRITSPVYTYAPPPTLRNLSKIGFQDFLKVDLFRDLQSAISEYTTSSHLKHLFSRFATYMGANPYHTPAILSVIAHVELSKGVWYPRGGIFTLAQALERLAIEKGVKIRTNQAVNKIVIQDREVRGIVFEDESVVEAGTIISNVDYATTYASLLPRKPPYTWELENYEKNLASSSAFILLLGVKGRYGELTHHNVIFSEDYRKEFQQIFREKTPPDDPTVYIAVSSKSDYNHAPAGHENWFVMVNVPSLDGKYDWQKNAQAYKRKVLNKLAMSGFNIDENIVVERVITPLDLEQMTGAYHGSIYGLTYDNWQAFFRRPKPRPKSPSGLFFVGGTTHPGGGVAMVALSGKYVSQLVMEQEPS